MILRLYAALLAILVLFVIGVLSAHSQPPEGADPNSETAKWFRSLAVPSGVAGSCCSESDCRPVETRISPDGHWEALITQEQYGRFGVKEPFWVTVPPEKVLNRTENPIGRAVLCWTPTLGPLCFIRPEES